MSPQVVVTLPDDLYAHAQHWAALTHREVPQLLTEALALVLTPDRDTPCRCPTGRDTLRSRSARLGADADACSAGASS
jgi:hypothetical protein